LFPPAPDQVDGYMKGLIQFARRRARQRSGDSERLRRRKPLRTLWVCHGSLSRRTPDARPDGGRASGLFGTPALSDAG
jgi:hypothetical protein